MPKSVELNIKKVRYEELLDQTEKDISKITKIQTHNKDKMIASIIELLLAYAVYQIITHLGDQEYASELFAFFTTVAKILCLALFIRVIYHACRLFIHKHPVQKKYMSCNRVIEELKKDCVKYKERIKQIKQEYEAALEDEADERGVSLNEKIKAFESSGSRAYSFYEDILPDEDERARRAKENEPSDIERAIMQGFTKNTNN